jgi:PAS domain-containing protein
MEKRHLLAWQPNNEEKQRSFLRAIIDNISDLVLAKDLDGRFYFRQPRAPGWMRAVRVVARVRFIHVGNSAWLRRERQAGHRERPCDNRRRDHTLPWLHAVNARGRHAMQLAEIQCGRASLDRPEAAPRSAQDASRDLGGDVREGRAIDGQTAGPRGACTWWDIVVIPIPAENGAPWKLLATCGDVTRSRSP